MARRLAVSPPPVPGRPPSSADEVGARLEEARRRIAAAGGDPAAVTVVAVTKGFTAAAVAAALAAGIRDIGENYAAEIVAKSMELALPPGAGDPCWHYLGTIQRRRVGALAPVVSCWQTLARAAEGEAIARRAPGARVLVEVETTGLPGRNGCPPARVPDLVATLAALGLQVTGLMTIGPPGPAEDSRDGFRRTARLAAELGLAELSMGMTDDLEIGVAEGATMVRIGRGLFGERPARRHENGA